MRTVVETQAYLDEAKAHTIIKVTAVMAALKAIVPQTGQVAQQANLLARLLQASELIEPDAELLGHYDSMFNTLGSIRRITGEIERQMRDLALCYRQLNATDVEMRAQAGAAGYTV